VIALLPFPLTEIAVEEDDPEMEEVSAGDADESSSTVPTWMKPVRRNDQIGKLAWLLCGELGAMPDLTAGPLLVDELRATYGDAAADDCAHKLVVLLNLIPRSAVRDIENNPNDDFSHFATNFRRQLRKLCAAYLYDLTSACGIMSRFLELACRPVKPVAQRPTQVDLVYLKLPSHMTPGDRCRLPDGRRGTVMIGHDANGECGVLPHNETNQYDGPMMQDSTGGESDGIL